MLHCNPPPEGQQAELASCRAHLIGLCAGMWLLLAQRVACWHVRHPSVCSSGAASEVAGPFGLLGCSHWMCGIACADVVLLCPAGAGRDSARGNSGQVGAGRDSARGNAGQANNGAASKGHSAAGRAGQSRVKQGRVSQPAPDSSDAASMEPPSPAKQEADTKLEPEVRMQSLALKTA